MGAASACLAYRCYPDLEADLGAVNITEDPSANPKPSQGQDADLPHRDPTNSDSLRMVSHSIHTKADHEMTQVCPMQRQGSSRHPSETNLLASKSAEARPATGAESPNSRLGNLDDALLSAAWADSTKVIQGSHAFPELSRDGLNQDPELSSLRRALRSTRPSSKRAMAKTKLYPSSCKRELPTEENQSSQPSRTRPTLLQNRDEDKAQLHEQVLQCADNATLIKSQTLRQVGKPTKQGDEHPRNSLELDPLHQARTVQPNQTALESADGKQLQPANQIAQSKEEPQGSRQPRNLIMLDPLYLVRMARLKQTAQESADGTQLQPSRQIAQPKEESRDLLKLDPLLSEAYSEQDALSPADSKQKQFSVPLPSGARVILHLPDFSNASTRRARKFAGPYNATRDPEDTTPVVKLPPVQYADKSVYVGEWNKHGQRHGLGEMHFPDGSTLTGCFRDDSSTFRCRAISEDGSYYEGEWAHGQPHGFGKYRQHDGAIYEGNWKSGCMSGYGMESLPSGFWYQGMFKLNQRHGKGLITWADGASFEGTFVRGQFESGMYRDADDQVYEHRWGKDLVRRQTEPSSRCEQQSPTTPRPGDSRILGKAEPLPPNHIFQNPESSQDSPLKEPSEVPPKRKHEREVINGVILPAGARVIQQVPDFSNANTRKAEQLAGPYESTRKLRDTTAVIRLPPIQYPDGSVYVGEWSKWGLRHGIGKHYFPDGATIAGFFQNDISAFKARAIYADGSYYEGKWNNNQAHGLGKIVKSDGSSYDGCLSYGRQNGYGVYRWADGQTYEGDWKNGKMTGHAVATTAAGKQARGEWRRGHLVNED